MKCFSGIPRWLLCTGSLPTHPSDQIIPVPDPTKPQNLNKDEESEEAKTDFSVSPPGLVARLMGLESLPDSNWSVSNNLKTPNSFERSRSVNSLDFLLEFDLKEAQHRRVRTSVSFREELPAFLQQENGDYFVVRSKNAEEKTKMSKWEMGLKEKQQKSTKNNVGGRNLKKKETEGVEKKKEINQNTMKNEKKIIRDEPRRVCSTKNKASYLSKTKDNFSGQRLESKAESSLIARKQRRTTSDSKVVAEKKIKKKVAECSSENSTSPVSVLDHIEFSEESVGSNPSPGGKSSVKRDNVDIREIKKRDPEQRKKDGNDENEDIEFFLKALGEMRRLAEEEIKMAKWVSNKSSISESFEIICSELEQHVFDVLVYQVVYELANM